MRFLQTEWHRHERERNAWEIEKQEMRGRIAHLEGSARRSDATQKALHRYNGMLQTKIRELNDQQASKANDAGGSSSTNTDGAAERNDRKERLSEKVNGV